MRYEKMTFHQKIGVMQKLHKDLNKGLFESKLSHVQLSIENLRSNDTAAMFLNPEENLNNFKIENGQLVRNETSRIIFNYDFEEYMTKFRTIREQKYFLMMVLLHEMIHQYCYENNIDDTSHNENFQKEAEAHYLHSKYENGEFIEEYIKSLMFPLFENKIRFPSGRK